MTDELQEKICALIVNGNYIETAAQYCGVSKVALYDWFKKGNKQTRGKYRKFLNAVGKAVAEAEARDVSIITLASVRDWRAAAWRLERRAPKRWGFKSRLELTGEDGGPVEISGAFNSALDAIYGPKYDDDDGQNGSGEIIDLVEENLGEKVEPGKNGGNGRGLPSGD